MKLLFFCLFISLPTLLFATSITTKAAAPRKPNIVVFLADDFGWGNIGYHRDVADQEVQTPNMDLLAKTGVMFERFYSYKMCSPSRSSFQSGRLAQHVNAVNLDPTTVNFNNRVSGYAGIPPNMTCFAEKLRSLAGYRTVFTGKWDVGMATPKQTPMGRGYDEFLGYYHHANDYWTQGVPFTAVGEVDVCLNRYLDLWHNHVPAKIQAGTAYEEILFENHTVTAIRNHDLTKPLLLVHSFHLIHTPLQVPDSYLEKFSFIDYASRQKYAAMVNYMDDTIGRIVNELKKRKGMYENTLCVFFSDNGGPIYLPGSASNYPLRAGKYSDLEGGIRVNAFAFGGVIPRNRRGKKVSKLLHISDMYASFIRLAMFDLKTNVISTQLMNQYLFDDEASAAGLPMVDSINTLWDAITDNHEAPPRTEIHISANALMIGQYKLLTGMQPYNMWVGPLYPNATGYQPPFIAQQSPQLDCTSGCLFNVFTDPTEHNDLALQMPDLVKTMSARLAQLNQANFNPDRGCQTVLACVVAEKLYGGFYGPFMELPSGMTNFRELVPGVALSDAVQFLNQGGP